MRAQVRPLRHHLGHWFDLYMSCLWMSLFCRPSVAFGCFALRLLWLWQSHTVPLPVSGHVVSLLAPHIFSTLRGWLLGLANSDSFLAECICLAFVLGFSFSSERHLSTVYLWYAAIDWATLRLGRFLSSKSFSSSASNSSPGQSREIQSSFSLSPSSSSRISPSELDSESGPDCFLDGGSLAPDVCFHAPVAHQNPIHRKGFACASLRGPSAQALRTLLLLAFCLGCLAEKIEQGSHFLFFQTCRKINPIWHHFFLICPLQCPGPHPAFRQRNLGPPCQSSIFILRWQQNLQLRWCSKCNATQAITDTHNSSDSKGIVARLRCSCSLIDRNSSLSATFLGYCN